MNKLKQIFIIFCILLFIFLIVACSDDTPKPSDEDGVRVSGRRCSVYDDPLSSAGEVFTITQDRILIELFLSAAVAPLENPGCLFQ